MNTNSAARWMRDVSSQYEWMNLKCFWKDTRIHRGAKCLWAGGAFIYHGEESEMGGKKKKGCETIEEKWMEALAEVRIPRCGDELVEAHYHRTVWWYNLSLSINPWLCPWFKFTICYKNVYCSKATFYWILFRGDSASQVQQHLACKWELPSCLITIALIWL